MAKHFQLAHAFYSYECLEAQLSSCDSTICSCPCHFITDDLATQLMTSMLGCSILHLLFSYKRSRLYDVTFATAVQQSKLHPQKETPS